MKITSWNVNSVNARLEHLIKFIKEDQSDIYFLQELKTIEDGFPKDVINEIGYKTYINGQKAWNGVAILSKKKINITNKKIPNYDDENSRFIETEINLKNIKKKIKLINIYLPNGNPIDTDKFKFIQVPYNLAMTNYLTKKTQFDIKNNKSCSLIYLAEQNNIDVITSAPLYHGKLISIELPENLKKIFYDVKTNAELSLKFSMSNPGSNSILVGVTNLSHLEDIISIADKDLIHINDYSKILMGE